VLSGDVVAVERITGPILDTGCSILDAVTVAATAKQTSVGRRIFTKVLWPVFFIKLVFFLQNTAKEQFRFIKIE